MNRHSIQMAQEWKREQLQRTLEELVRAGYLTIATVGNYQLSHHHSCQIA